MESIIAITPMVAARLGWRGWRVWVAFVVAFCALRRRRCDNVKEIEKSSEEFIEENGCKLSYEV